MKYFELICTAYLKDNIPFKYSFDAIARYIDFSMFKNEKIKELHNQTGLKLYVFDSFYPIEKEKIYKKGNSYQFTIRSLDEKFIDILSKTLRENINNPNFLVVETHKKTIKQFSILELYSVTPVILSIGNGLYWSMDRDGDMVRLIKQLHYNLEKKYQAFYKEPIKSEQNFIHSLELKNRYPQSIYMKKNSNDVRFFGNKFRLIPHEDEVSQKLAFVALACGLGEKNSFGGGFCIAKGLS